MNLWEGYMNWPLSADWKCETCGGRNLIWGLQHAVCRCDTCHTEYYMRDENQKVVDCPICLLKDEYKKPAREGWALYRRPISAWSDGDWEKVSAESPRRIP